MTFGFLFCLRRGNRERFDVRGRTHSQGCFVNVPTVLFYILGVSREWYPTKLWVVNLAVDPIVSGKNSFAYVHQEILRKTDVEAVVLESLV